MHTGKVFSPPGPFFQSRHARTPGDSHYRDALITINSADYRDGYLYHDASVPEDFAASLEVDGYAEKVANHPHLLAQYGGGSGDHMTTPGSVTSKLTKAIRRLAGVLSYKS